ncbi:MAG TPA: TRAM domain-containing protein [Candidatus Binatia bacterium]|nr:TRAM domain-containing protein [Candidatus Binatia bacterium]
MHLYTHKSWEYSETTVSDIQKGEKNMYGNRGGYGGHREGGSSSGGGYGPRPMTAPVKVGEEMDVTIEAVGEKGDGLAKKNGFVLFVPGVKEGQQVRIRVTKVLRKVGFAEVIGDAGSGSSEPAAESSSEAPAEEAPAEEQAEEASDSEDFGEEQQ